MRPSSVLDVIILIYYIPAFLLSILVLLKQGRRGITGWISLTLLSVFRVVGSSAGIASEYNTSTTAVTLALIFGNIGTISLLAALMGIIKRANTSMTHYSLSERMLRITQLPITIAAPLAIVGGVDSTSSDPSDHAQGRTFIRVAVILLLVVYLTAVGLCAYTGSHKHDVLISERRLLLVSTLSLPFALIRLILAFCSAFRPTDPNFSIISTTDSAVVIRAIMGILMEWIVVAIFTWAGLTVNTEIAESSRQQTTQTPRAMVHSRRSRGPR